MFLRTFELLYPPCIVTLNIYTVMDVNICNLAINAPWS